MNILVEKLDSLRDLLIYASEVETQLSTDHVDAL